MYSLARFYDLRELFLIGACLDFKLRVLLGGDCLPMKGPQTALQLLFQHGNIGDSAIVGAARAFAGNIRHCDDVDLMAEVIEGEQAVEEHQDAIGNGQVVLRMFADVFQVADDIVSKVADGASGEGREAGDRSWTMLAQLFLQDFEYISGEAFCLRLPR